MSSDYSIIVIEIRSMHHKEKTSHQAAVNKLLHRNISNLFGLDHQDSHISTVEIAFLQIRGRILKHHFQPL